MPAAPPPDAAYLDRLRDITYRPVFIVGSHRSGTTFLHRLLHASGCFNVLTAYQVINYDEVLANFLGGTETEAKRRLAERFRAAGLTTQGIDNVELTPDSEEEYGFVLHEGTTLDSLLARRDPILTERNLPKFVEACRKVQFTEDPARPILLKNPWDYANFLEVKRLVPDAKLVILHRHPARTVNSQLKAVRQLTAARNEYIAMLSPAYVRAFRRPLLMRLARWLFDPKRRSGLKGIIRRHAKSVRLIHARAAEVPAADRYEVRYEDMCAKPNEVVNAVLGWLGLEGDAKVDYAAMVETRAGKLLPEVAARQDDLAGRLADYYAAHGYAPHES
jgi:hypothetical protein